MIQVKLKDWDEYQNREVKTSTKWVRVPNDLMTRPFCFALSHEEFSILMYIIFEASKANKNGWVDIIHEHIHCITRCKTHCISRAIEKLQELRVVEVRTTRGSYVENPGSLLRKKEREEREERKIIHGVFETPIVSEVLEQKQEQQKTREEIFDEIYQLYPKRQNTNRKRGIENLLSKVKTQEQVEEFKTAVMNYAAYVVAEKTEPRFVKQFSTFVNNYAEWVTVEKITRESAFEKRLREAKEADRKAGLLGDEHDSE